MISIQKMILLNLYNEFCFGQKFPDSLSQTFSPNFPSSHQLSHTSLTHLCLKMAENEYLISWCSGCGNPHTVYRISEGRFYFTDLKFFDCDCRDSLNPNRRASLNHETVKVGESSFNSAFAVYECESGGMWFNSNGHSIHFNNLDGVAPSSRPIPRRTRVSQLFGDHVEIIRLSDASRKSSHRPNGVSSHRRTMPRVRAPLQIHHVLGAQPQLPSSAPTTALDQVVATQS